MNCRNLYSVFSVNFKMPIRLVANTVGLAVVLVAILGSAAETQVTWPFFAFDNGTGGSKVPFDQQAKMLKGLGYDGIAYGGTQRIPEMLAALDDQGLKMLSIYVGVNVSAKRGQPPYPPGLKTAIEQLKGRDTQIWLFIKGGKSASANRDDQAVAVLREVADMADRSGLRVAIYPHVGFYAERVENALRLIKKADRKNLGLCFNLCHFLKLDNEKNLDARLKEAMPHLLAVNINGTDGGQTNAMGWGRLILSLDRGNFDVGRVRGPACFQTVRQEQTRHSPQQNGDHRGRPGAVHGGLRQVPRRCRRTRRSVERPRPVRRGRLGRSVS